ncbi:MAG: endopeptidase [Proteobacteria bacterium]|nr:endopeptidase [Pseudomonadota bacterium]
MSSHDPLDIRGQEQAREEAQQRNKLAEKTEAEDIKWQMANKRGRRIVYRLLERAGIWQSSFNTNAMQMAFNEGRRNEGLALLAKLMAYCPELYAVMLKEQDKNG